MKKFKTKNNEKMEISGITLVALVITIVILIILAGIVIIGIQKNGGLINKVKLAKEKYEEAKQGEENIFSQYTNRIYDEYITESNRDEDNNYIEIKDENAKKIILFSKKKYAVNSNTLFNDYDYVNNIINSDDAINYIINNKNILDDAINSQYMMRNLLKSSKKNIVVSKLLEKSYTNPQLTSSNGNDGGNCFGTEPYPSFGYQIWWGFNKNNEYAYNGTGNFNLGYKFNTPIWCFEFSFSQRFSVNEGVDNLIVQYSDDGSNWINSTDTIKTLRNTTTQEYIINNAIGKHLYWRITGSGYGSNGGLSNLKFYGIN